MTGARKRVVLLGATGSVGKSALRVLAAQRERLELVGASAAGSWRELAAIARTHRIRTVAIANEAAALEAKHSGEFPMTCSIRQGGAGVESLAALPEADIVLVAIVGAAALAPTLAAIGAGKDVALASKEVLVLAGKFVMEEARRRGVRILPVDSEHNAIFQCAAGHPGAAIRKVILTASGGAFRDWPLERLASATPAEALRHPNWSMGPKITVDSATMANKGLELIEALWLFGLKPEQCSAVIHPQSIVHGLVEFTDGAMLAHLSPPAMTFPIQHALLHPERTNGVEAAVDLTRLLTLDFRPVDETRYPMMRLARESLAAGGVAPGVFNAANEVAVGAFLAGRIPFLAIPAIVSHALDSMPNFEPTDLGAVLGADGEARRTAEARIAQTVFA